MIDLPLLVKYLLAAVVCLLGLALGVFMVGLAWLAVILVSKCAKHAKIVPCSRVFRGQGGPNDENR
jgi:hypothetical protein